jgi:predicted  nucleic acid-binding Zn-ribbon protein
MWMLDVFCCALGCVTLLFLLNSRMATDAVQANRTALLDLESADKKLAAALTSLDATRLKLTAEEQERGRLAANVTQLESGLLKLADDSRRLAEQLKLARAEKDETAKRLARTRDDATVAQARLDATQTALNAAEKKADATAKELATARSQVDDATDLLKKRQKDTDALAKKEAASAAQVDALQRLVRTKDDERTALETRMAAARKELTDLEAKLRATQKDLDANLAAARAAAKAAGEELANAKATAAKSGEELSTARAQIKDLAKKVDDANVTIIDLQGEKAKLADTFNKFQKESESRFAGIAMTGKSVVFLVDMSGSMGKRDLNTVDDTKWPLVIETVCKVMRSIPTLERYQVIVFSSGADWVFGSGEWQTFTGEKSVEAVKTALLKVKPKDDTNMYAALEKAFALRAAGLDTLYLFSDGLPTSGPGLTAAQQNANLPESELGVILGRHVRDALARTWNRPEPGRPRVRINSVGFYFDSPDVGAFLWSLSRENDGSFVGMSRP